MNDRCICCNSFMKKRTNSWGMCLRCFTLGKIGSQENLNQRIIEVNPFIKKDGCIVYKSDDDVEYKEGILKRLLRLLKESIKWMKRNLR